MSRRKLSSESVQLGSAGPSGSSQAVPGKCDTSVAAIFDRVGPVAYSLASWICRDAAATEAAVVDGFAAVLARPPAAGSALQEIVEQVRRNAVAATRRRRGSSGACVSSDAAAGAGGSLAALPSARQRRLIELQYFDGYSQREIAEMCDLPADVVRRETAQGLRALVAAAAPPSPSGAWGKDLGGRDDAARRGHRSRSTSTTGVGPDSHERGDIP